MMEDKTGQDVESPQDARLDSLDERLKRAQIREAERTGQAPMTDANEQLGQRVLSTLLGGLFGGAVIGWLLDKWLGTGHLLLVVMMVLGTVVSILSFTLMIGITLLELLVSAIQAYVFALLTSLYLNDAINLH